MKLTDDKCFNEMMPGNQVSITLELTYNKKITTRSHPIDKLH